MNLKICGMKYRDNIEAVASAGPDYMGFIFYSGSPRFVGEDWPVEAAAALPASIGKVGVFVDAPEEYILAKAGRYSLDMVQLHGSESPEFCSAIARHFPVMKAFGVSADFDFSTLTPYENSCRFFLLDTRTPGHGGSGLKFDWDLLRRYPSRTPFFLSGGIGLEDAGAIGGLEGLPIHAVDLNSRFETAYAVKDPDKFKQFKDKLSNV